MSFGIKREHVWLALLLLLIAALMVAQQQFLAWLFGAGPFLMASVPDLSWAFTDDPADVNRRNAQETNRLNRFMYNAARGKWGNAVLPMYLRNADSSPWEQTLGQDLMAGYNAGNTQSSEEQMQAYRDVLARTQPMSDAASGRASEIFDGGITRRLTESAAPTQAARLEIAPMRRQATMEALSKTLSAIDAAQNARGFGGDGLAANRLRFDATREANTSAADALTAARLDNAMETQRIRDYGDVQLPLQNLSLPYTMARQNVDLFNLPQDAYLDNLARRLQPLNFLRIGGAAPFQYSPLPQVGPDMRFHDSLNTLNQGVQEGVGTALNSNFRNQQIQALQAQQNQQAFMARQQQLAGGNPYANSPYANVYQQPAMSYAGGYTPPAATGGYGGGLSYDGGGGYSPPLVSYADVSSIGY